MKMINNAFNNIMENQTFIGYLFIIIANYDRKHIYILSTLYR